MKLLLFDVDLTLVNTGGAGLRALDRACLEHLRIAKAMNGIRPHGKTDPAIVREIFRVRLGSHVPNGEVQKILELYLLYLQEEVRLSPGYRVLPGILSLLEETSLRNDALLGLATGNIEAGARIKLERAGLNAYFAIGGFGSDSEDRAELVRMGAAKAAAKIGGSFDPSDVFVIGDTTLDIDAGRAAGFQTIGVATGSHSVEQLLASGATIAVTDLESGRDYFFQTVFKSFR